MLDAGELRRGWIDYAGMAASGLCVLVLIVVGVYGAGHGALQTIGYYHANNWVALGVGLVGAGCIFYLYWEIVGPPFDRRILALCFVLFMFSALAVTKGVPAIAAEYWGRPAEISLTVTGFEPGGRSCSTYAIARHPDYETLRTCTRNLRREARAGDTINVSGPATTWGIRLDSVELADVR